MERVNTDIIIGTMKSWVEERQPISPSKWIDASAKLNIFLGDENNKLYDLEHILANKKFDLLMDPDMKVNKANAIIEATEEYRDYRKQNAKIKQIQEFIRIAKKQATLASEEIKSY